MYCSGCGKKIKDNAVICVHCGCPTNNFNQTNKPNEPIIINNNNNNNNNNGYSGSYNDRYNERYNDRYNTENNRYNEDSKHNVAENKPVREKKKYNLFFDILMTFLTSGLWIIWIILRPKYKK